jgi:DNA polymerase III delta prime subunit
MTRKKRTSRILENTKLRVVGLKAIDQKMDFGDARNLQNITQVMEELDSKIDAYNSALIVIDSSQQEIKDLEKSLSELSEKMLIGVAFKYGKDSREYEMAGGVRKSERIRRSTATRLKTSAK